MANVKKSVSFKPEILERILAEKKMSLNELALRIANKNHISKEAEMTSLRRYKRQKQISLSALEDIGQILNIDPNIIRGREIKYVHMLHENTVRSALESDQTFQSYTDRKDALNNLDSYRFIDRESLEQYLSGTPLYVDVQKLDEAQREYYLHLLSVEMQRLLIVAATTEVELEYTEIQGKTTIIAERFKIIKKSEETLPHPEDFYVSKKG